MGGHEGLPLVDNCDVVLVGSDESDEVVVDDVPGEAHEGLSALEQDVGFGEVSCVELAEGAVGSDCGEDVRVRCEADVEDLFVVGDQLVDDGPYPQFNKN